MQSCLLVPSNNATAARTAVAHASLIISHLLRLIMVLHHFFHVYSFPPSWGFSFCIIASSSISTSVNLTAFSSALSCYGPTCQTSIYLEPVDSAQSLLPWSLFLMTACLSFCQRKQSLCLSINVFSFDFLFLSVYLSVWCVGSCLGALGLLSAKFWFLFFCQFTCLSETLRLDMSMFFLVFLSSGMDL